MGTSDASRSCVLPAAQYAVWDLGADEIPSTQSRLVVYCFLIPLFAEIDRFQVMIAGLLNHQQYGVCDCFAFALKGTPMASKFLVELEPLKISQVCFGKRTSSSLIETMLSIVLARVIKVMCSLLVVRNGHSSLQRELSESKPRKEQQTISHFFLHMS